MNPKTTKIIVDSTLVTTPQQANDFGFSVCPLKIGFGQETYTDFVDIQVAELYRRLRNKEVAITSQPSAGDFLTLYETLKQEGAETIFVFTLSQKLSGTWQSANTAANMLEGCTVRVVDTGLTTAVCAHVIASLCPQIAQWTADEFVHEATKAFASMGLCAVVENLDYLMRGGRLSKANALVANLLKIKPILAYLPHGEVKVVDKARTRAKAFDLVMQRVQAHHPKRLFLLTTDEGNKEAETAFLATINQTFPDIQVDIEQLCSALGAHVGPEACVIAWMGETA